MTRISTSPSPALQDRIRIGLQETEARIFRIDFEGKVFWVKRPETRSLFGWLQKGSSAKTFDHERFALQYLASKGAPVSCIVAQGEDYVVTQDLGTPVDQIMRMPDVSGDTKARIMAEAARALADLHCRHLSHGRPNLRDICWDGKRIAFIDFERFALSRNAPAGHAQDVILFLFSAYSLFGRHTPEIDAAMAAYRAAAPEGIWALAETWCQKRRWLYWLSKPANLFRRSRELKALPLTFEAFLSIQ